MAQPAQRDRQPLPPTFPDLRSLEVLISVRRLGSLSAAAVAHGISQPSASARIRSLERQVGVGLLQRGAAGSTPTPNGELVADWSERLLHAADEFNDSLATLTRAPTSPVTIAASYTIAEFLLPRWLAAWRPTSGRGVELEVVNSTEVLGRLQRSEVELGFVETTGAISDLDSADIGHDELVCVVAPTHPLAHSTQPLTPTDLVRADLISRETGSGTREALADALRRAGTEPPMSSLELGSTSAVRGAVADGAGLAVLSRLTVAADLASGALVELATTGLDLHRPLRAAWRKGRLSTAGRTLIDAALG